MSVALDARCDINSPGKQIAEAANGVADVLLRKTARDDHVVTPLDQRSRITPFPSHSAATAFARVVEQQHRPRIFLGRFEIRSAKRLDDWEIDRLDLFLGFVPVKLDALEIYPSQNADDLFIFRILDI